MGFASLTIYTTCSVKSLGTSDVLKMRNGYAYARSATNQKRFVYILMRCKHVNKPFLVCC